MDDNKKETFWIIDGLQRLTAILDFRAGKFKTRGRAGKDVPIEPNCYYSEMTEMGRNIFDAYNISINSIDENVPIHDVERLFRNIQHQAPLRGPEMLSSYSSDAHHSVNQVEVHPFWKEVFVGSRKRREAFQGSLMFVVLEYTGGYANMRSDALTPYIRGDKDAYMPDTIGSTTYERMDILCHLFDGLSFNKRSCAVFLYQTVMFLENEGYIVRSKDKGALTTWAANIIRQYEARTAGFYNVSYQREFWERELPKVLEIIAANAS
jgi:hypothetical protein